MTREELKKHCLKQIENCEMWAQFHGEEPHGKVYEEHKLILELLEQESGNAISRQAVLDGLGSIAKVKAKSDAQKSLMGRVMFFVEQLPPVTPQHTDAEVQKMQELEQAEIQKAYELGKAEQPKTGHWIAVENEEIETVGYYCSECDLPMETEQRTNFCPNCGAKMAKPRESEK